DRDVDQDGVCFEKTGEGNLVGFFDGRVVQHLRERPRRVAVAVRTRLTGERDAFAARRHDVVAEAGETDVDDLQRVLEEGLHRDCPALRFAERSATWPAVDDASILLPAMIAPVEASVLIWPVRSCGSRSVPQTWPIVHSLRPCCAAVRCASRSASARSSAGLGCDP